jgi:hypothetical protein
MDKMDTGGWGGGGVRRGLMEVEEMSVVAQPTPFVSQTLSLRDQMDPNLTSHEFLTGSSSV